VNSIVSSRPDRKGPHHSRAARTITLATPIVEVVAIGEEGARLIGQDPRSGATPISPSTKKAPAMATVSTSKGTKGTSRKGAAETKDGTKNAEPMSGKDYEKALKPLHIELVKLQEWVKHAGLKVCVVFEGRDGAGKGGTIKAITERTSPRVFRVVALPAPTEREKSQMYMQRYVPHFPAAGEVVIFDRSWYNRAGVERVMGFCTEEQATAFLAGAPLIEKAMVDSGIVLIKYWLEVGADEQTRRLESRIADGRKIWKLSPMDVKSYDRWLDYSRARDEMFKATDTSWAPWYVVRSDDKRRARLNLITHLLGRVPYKDLKRDKVKLPKRRTEGKYREIDYPFKFVPEQY
jgi:polyphosphate kinase 2